MCVCNNYQTNPPTTSARFGANPETQSLEAMAPGPAPFCGAAEAGAAAGQRGEPGTNDVSPKLRVSRFKLSVPDSRNAQRCQRPNSARPHIAVQKKPQSELAVLQAPKPCESLS